MHSDSDTSYLVPPESRATVSRTTYRVYPIRWAVVLVLAFLNGTNAYLWISFAPVADHFVAFYSTNEVILNWMQLIFPITTVVLGLPASLLVDWFGIRFITLFASLANSACGLLRLISSLDISAVQGWRIYLVFIGQLLASLAQPLCMFAPTKLALDWFPDHQRTIANTIGSLGNSVGVLLGSALAPVIIRRQQDIPTFNYVTLGVVLLGCLLTLVFVRRQKPATPPSVVAAVSDQLSRSGSHSLRARLKLFFINTYIPLKSFGFWLVMVTFGCGLAYFTALSTLFEQILCAKGYSNQAAGMYGSVMIGAGLVASGFLAWFVDRTGLLVESVKVCFMLAALGAVTMSLIIYFPNQSVGLVIAIIWFGGFGFGQYSLALELAAEMTFPVPEAITTGMLIAFSQVLSIVFVLFMQALAVEADNRLAPTCGPAATPRDYTLPNLAVCAIVTVVGLVQMFWLRAKYKRRKAAFEHTSIAVAPGNVECPGLNDGQM